MSISEAQEVFGRWPNGTSKEKISNACMSRVPSITVLSTIWYPEIMKGLKSSSKEFFNDLLPSDWTSKIPYNEIEVPGSFEMPLAAKLAYEGKLDGQSGPADIVIALGCVVKGGTPHFDYVCGAVSSGLMQLQLEFGKALGFGVLTVNNIEEAMARREKGHEAAQAALAMWYLKSAL